MIKIGARQNYKTARLLRRLSTSNDQARPCATHDNRLKARSPLRDADYAYRNRPNSFVMPPNASGNRPPAPKSLSV